MIYSRLKDLNTNIQIKKSKRKSVTIEIDNKGNVLVKAPLYATNKKINEILEIKEEWIFDNVCKMRERNKDILERKYVSGEKVLMLGENYIIKVSDFASINHAEKVIYIKNEGNQNEIIKLYKSFASEYIKERVNYFSSKFEIAAKDIKIKSQKTIWGSCTKDNILSFNYKIIMARKEIIDYLVVHEMSHMIHKNHSSDFWKCVENIIKDAKKIRKELKEITYMLEI